MIETALVRYDAMIYAIAECHRVDEVKDLRDKAMALEMYAKQARNVEAERKACDVRLRAERRAGELLKELARATPQGGDFGNQHTGGKPASVAGPPSPYREALDSAQIPERTAQRYQQLASVPREIFEEHLRDPIRKPTTTALINQARDPQPHKQMPEEALGIWGTLRDFERLRYFKVDPEKTFGAMTETMQDDVRRLVPLVLELLSHFEEVMTNEYA